MKLRVDGFPRGPADFDVTLTKTEWLLIMDLIERHSDYQHISRVIVESIDMQEEGLGS